MGKANRKKREVLAAIEKLALEYYELSGKVLLITEQVLEESRNEKKTFPREPGLGAHNLYCSFCGKNEHEVRKMMAGQDAFICDECIELCWHVVEHEAR